MPSILLTSFLVGSLKQFGPWFAPQQAAAFLASAGRSREIFLPFFYRWFDDRQWAQDQALRLIEASVRREGIAVPRVFHAPFTGRHGLPLRGYHRDLAGPRRVREHGISLQRECRFFGRLRTELGVRDRILYILHLGRRNARPAPEALRVAIEAIRPAVEPAAAAGVVLALENVADSSGDEGAVGARIPEIADALASLGGGDHAASPVGWTFDVAHALLAYRGDAAAIAADLRALLPSLVHVHVNAPRFYPSEVPWSDRHEAPTEGFRPLWDLFRQALAGPRFQEFQTVTYEVNWAAPLLNPLVGGSPLPAVARGYDLVRTAAIAVLGALEARVRSPYPLTRAAPVIAPSPTAVPAPVQGS